MELLDSLPQSSDSALPGPTTQFPDSAPGNVLVQIHRDAFDRGVQVLMGDGSVRIVTYDPASNAIDSTLVGSDGAVPPSAKLLAEVHQEFDEMNRRVREIVMHVDAGGQPIGAGSRTTTLRYDLAGRPVEASSGSGHFTQMAWNNTRMIAWTDAADNDQLFVYDLNGNLTGWTQRDVSTELGTAVEEFETELEYDALDRLVRRTDAMGDTFEWRHDSRGNVVETRDARVGQGLVGNRVLFEHDALNRLACVERILTDTGRGDGAEVDRIVTCQEWDADSLLRSRTDGAGLVTQYGYDELGRVTSKTRPDGSVETRGYNADGQRSSWTDPNGSVATVLFDALGRPVERRFALGSGVIGTTLERFFYDGAGRPTRVENDDVFGAGPRVLGLEYDSHGNRTLEEQGGLAVESEFDAYGNRVRLVYPGDLGASGPWTVETTFDVLDRATAMSGSSASSPSTIPIARNRYKGPHRLESRTYGDDALPTVELDIAYDDGQRPIDIHFVGGYGAAAYQYAYEGTCQPVFEKLVHDGGEGEVFEHDSLGRLVAEKHGDLSNYFSGQFLDAHDFTDDQSTSWTYDPLGSRTAAVEKDGAIVATTTYATGPLAEYESLTEGSTTEPFEYDANGNLTATVDRAYAYDALNRLVEVRDAQGGLVERYGYDGLGRRVQTAGPGGGPHVRVFDGLRCIEERDSNGLVEHQYVWNATRSGQHADTFVYTIADDGVSPASHRLFLLDIGTTENLGFHEMPGLHKSGDITLKRGTLRSELHSDLFLYNEGAGSDFNRPDPYRNFNFQVSFGSDPRFDPYKNFKFRVSWGGTPASAPLGQMGNDVLLGEGSIDGAVAAGDYLLWRDHFGQSSTDSDVDGRDFLKWQRGASPSSTHSGVTILDLATWDANFGSSPSRGGWGNDLLNADDTMRGGDGVDVLRGGAGNDVLIGGRGNDVVLGSEGRDVLLSGAGHDMGDGAAGSDALGASVLISVRSPNGRFFPLVDGRRNVTGMVDDSGNLVEEIRYTAFGSSTQTGSASDNEYKYVNVRRFPATGLYEMDGRDYDPVLGRFLQRDPRGAWADGGNLGNGYTRDGNEPARAR